MQVDTRERGFSYAYDAPLDMRMDPTQELDAREIVNTWDERRLARVLREYGEERYAGRIAARDRRARRGRSRPPTSSSTRSAPRSPRRRASPAAIPAKRTFQAIRIAVNDELGQLDAALPLAWEILRAGRPPGRDLLPLARGSPRQALPRRPRARLHLPARPARLRLRPHARGRAGLPPLRRARRAGEVAANPRSKSARLRAARKLKEEPTDARHAAAAARRGHARRAPRPRRATAAPRSPARAAPRARRPPSRCRAPRAPPASSSASARSPEHRIVDRLLRGRAWISLIGVMLVGIVVMQVSLLQAQRRHRPRRRAVRARSSAPTPTWRREVARLSSGERIQAAAAEEGMVAPAGRRRRASSRARPQTDAAARPLERMRSPERRAREQVMANGGKAIAPVRRRGHRGRRRPGRDDAGRRPTPAAAAATTATRRRPRADPAPIAHAAPPHAGRRPAPAGAPPRRPG